MASTTVTDEHVLAAGDMASFEAFYRGHFTRVLGFFVSRTRDPELAADLTAETFAAALAARGRYRPEKGSADSWLFSIAFHKLADAQRRGYAEDRARRRLGMERLVLTDEDVAAIERLSANGRATRMLEDLAPDQRRAIAARVIEEREYGEIAAATATSEAVIRQRVSRGLTTIRRRMGARS
jgi:RNA polymerase sigma-70 factor (ECF subfamily)